MSSKENFENEDLPDDMGHLDDDALWDLAEKFADEWAGNYLEEMWHSEKEELKSLSRKELIEEMLFRGSAESFFFLVKSLQHFQIGNPFEDENLWEEGGYVKKINSEEMNKKMRTFPMGHDEEMNFNCKDCNAKISAHNQDWHNRLCDSCFNKEYHDGEIHIEE